MRILAIFLSAVAMYASDNISQTQKKDDSETLQNAESSSIPREIPIGLPESGTGSTIMEDGLKMTQAVIRDYFHWAGGNAYNSVRIMGLTESLIRSGDVGMVVDSRTRTGGDETSGAISVRTSNNGLIRFDGALGGAINKEKGWYYSVGAYVNLDPTSVNAPTRIFVDQKQIIKAAITKRWKRGELSVMAKMAVCSDNSGNAYSKAPFIYNGDGTVSLYNGFRLGRDCYFPADDYVQYKDVVTGQARSGNLAKMDQKIIYDFHADGSIQLTHNWDLGMNIQACFTPQFYTAENNMGGVVDASSADYSYADGKKYTGMVQLRLVTPHDMKCNDISGKFFALRKGDRNRLEAGLQLTYAGQAQYTSSFYYAHTVQNNPERIYLKGAPTWNINKNALYFDANLFNTTVYATDEWNATDNLFIRGGIRAGMPLYKVKCAADRIVDGVLETKYKRYEGFSLAGLAAKGTDLAVYTNRDIEGVPVDLAASLYLSYRLADGLYVLGEGFFSNENKKTTSYKGNKIPSLKPVKYAFGRVGLTYGTSWAKKRSVDLSLIGSYISSKDNSSFGTISNHARTLQNSFVYEYGIRTWSVTFDGNLKIGGFNLHALAVWQDPRYQNFRHTEYFDDGTENSVDYSNNYVTGISKWRIEIDPSYSWGKWKVAANLRYFSRQYASRNNLAYFNGRFESFASVAWKCCKGCQLSLNIINFLFQSGAQGTIAASDSAQTEEDLAGLVMCGSYIRPFTIDLGFTYKF